MPEVRSLVLLLVVAAALAAGGCATSTGSDRPDSDVTLLLDFQPNGVHAGIFLAAARGYDDAEGVRMKIRTPGASTDALRALRTGRAAYAILDIHDLGLARQRGADVVGVMAVVQRPLAAVIAQPGIRAPRDLEGERVGVTGLPSDDAVLRSVVRGGGGDPARVRRTTIGFEAVKALLAGRVQAATAFWSAEGVALRERRPGFREFRVDDYGAPAYPELVLCTTRERLQDSPEEARALIRALQRGYGETQRDPESAVTAMVDREPSLDRATVAAELDAVAPAFSAGAPAYGALDPGRLRRWSAWDVEFGILDRPVDVAQAFDTRLVGRVENP
ncbi:MAG TPA: ABC transporter substrate-binding protein [Solirubrobacteraceae bacterium]|jgi:ABC-type nitrate/sulfonate/bicarbonate transport system substrate-binding protein